MSGCDTLGWPNGSISTLDQKNRSETVHDGIPVFPGHFTCAIADVTLSVEDRAVFSHLYRLRDAPRPRPLSVPRTALALYAKAQVLRAQRLCPGNSSNEPKDKVRSPAGWTSAAAHVHFCNRSSAVKLPFSASEPFGVGA